ncbi:MAG: hypothetical protein HRT53_13160 [Colwellia sp.]|nr:hypothetical protein [Colwellia sp.]
MNKKNITVIIVIIATFAFYLHHSRNDFVDNIDQANEDNKPIFSSEKTNFVISADNKSTYDSISELSASNEETAKTSNTAITKQSENTHVSQYIPTAEFIESYAKFKTLVKGFNRLGNHIDSFANSEVDVEWTLKMENMIYNQMQYIAETGEQRFTNIQFNEIDCRSSMCKLNVGRMDLSGNGEQISDITSYLLGTESRRNADDYRKVITDNHDDGTTSFYFSRSVNDNLTGGGRE